MEQLKLALIGWLLSLPEDSGAIRQLDEIRHGGSLSAPPTEEEPLMGLKELSTALNYKHPTSLWRLGVKDVAETWGGTPRYRKSVVIEYLKSAKCQQRRRELAEKQKAAQKALKQRKTPRA